MRKKNIAIFIGGLIIGIIIGVFIVFPGVYAWNHGLDFFKTLHNMFAII